MSNKILKGATEYALDCFSDCGNVLVDYQRNQKAFVQIARLEGWKRIDGIWICPQCAAKKSINLDQKRAAVKTDSESQSPVFGG